MNYSDKTKDQLIKELQELRDQFDEIVQLEQQCRISEISLKTSEERLAKLFEYAPDAYYLIDFDTKIIDANKFAEELTGYSKEEIIEHTFLSRRLLPYNQIRKAISILNKNRNSQPTGPDELILRKKDGTLITAEVRNHPVDVDGRPLILSIARDITQRKQEREALRVSNQNLIDLVSSIPSGLLIFQYFIPNVLILIDGNSEAERLMDMKIENITGKNINDIFSSAQRLGLVRKMLNVIDSGQSYTSDEFHYLGKNIQGIYKIRAFMMEGMRLGVAFENVTVQKRAEENLKKSEESERTFRKKLMTLIEGTNNLSKTNSLDELCYKAVEWGLSRLGFDRLGIWFFGDGDNKERYGSYGTDVNGKICDERNIKNNYDDDSLCSSVLNYDSPHVIVKEDKRSTYLINAIAPILDGQKVIGYISSDNLIRKKPITENEGEILALYASSFGHLYSQKKMEESLEEEKERLTVTLRSIVDGVIVTDMAGKVFLINKVAENLTGWLLEEAVGKNIKDIFYVVDENTNKEIENIVDLSIEKGDVVSFDTNILISKHGIKTSITNSAVPIRDRESKIEGVIIVFQDNTEKKKLEEEIRKTHKLESLGIFAGGIAHDFNNLLTTILGNIGLAKLYSAPQERVYRVLAEAEKGSLQARDLTQQLLTFSKGGAPVKKKSSMKDLVKDTIEFTLHGSKVKFEIVIPDDLWAVEIDEGQISQVINNLVINAQQAMPQGGKIIVKLENIIITADKGLSFKGNYYVKISVADQGVGIPEKNLHKIFDPYFSTKEGGSGLGLAITYSIISKHDGYIDVVSKVNEGTTFSIFLPATGEQIEQKETNVREQPKAHGRILLMDDEKIIQQVSGDILNYLGYDTEFADDGSEALRKYVEFKESGNPFDAVIMDLTIPGGMGGKEAVQRLLGLDPEAKVIVSSGYSNDPVMADHKKYGFKGVVAKPYKISDLYDTIDAVINNKELI